MTPHDPRSTKVDRVQLLSEHATLSFILVSIYNKLYNKQLKVEHSLGDGLFCLDSKQQPITEQMVVTISQEMTSLLHGPTEIKYVGIPRSKLIDIFKSHNFDDKVGLLKTWSDDMISCIQIGEFIDYIIEPMSIDKDRLKIFELRAFKQGIILRFPTMLCPDHLRDWTDPTPLFNMFSEYREWAKLIDIETVSQLNSTIYKGKIDDLKWLAEGLHEQKLSKIAEHLVKHFPQKRVVTIAGPSSSNKTTFALRLGIQLRVNGHKSIVISMDDYYKNTVDIPYGDDGLQDFESIDALNIDILADRVHHLLNGEEVPSRRFDFKTGTGIDLPDKPLKIESDMFIIIEGIHGLNPELLNSLGSDSVTPIYVSALTPLNLDMNHRFPTSDLRLIRRIIRDYKFRGYSPRKTIMRWTSVRVGEERNIFPYQGNAELFFNSSLVYELPVLSIYGRALLAEATVPEEDEDEESESAKTITKEARRLQGMLNFFYPASVEIVPHISCIREFVGGSDLKY
jgi:uridine kinase